MGSDNFILSYLYSCVGGQLNFTDCSPLWQLGVIAALVVAASIVLLALLTQPQQQSSQ